MKTLVNYYKMLLESTSDLNSKIELWNKIYDEYIDVLSKDNRQNFLNDESNYAVYMDDKDLHLFKQYKHLEYGICFIKLQKYGAKTNEMKFINKTIKNLKKNHMTFNYDGYTDDTIYIVHPAFEEWLKPVFKKYDNDEILSKDEQRIYDTYNKLYNEYIIADY